MAKRIQRRLSITVEQFSTWDLMIQTRLRICRIEQVRRRFNKQKFLKVTASMALLVSLRTASSGNYLIITK